MIFFGCFYENANRMGVITSLLLVSLFEFIFLEGTSVSAELFGDLSRVAKSKLAEVILLKPLC